MSFLTEGIANAGIRIDWPSGHIHGPSKQSAVKRVGQLGGLFLDEAARAAMDQQAMVYSVEWSEPVHPHTEGGLFWGSTRIEPGRVGDEYFMTRGHFHAKRDRGEYYTTVSGEGLLLLMDEDRHSRLEKMTAGSTHYIPGYTAHRTINTGATPLVFWACWPSDAGHDYEAIVDHPFSLRVMHVNGHPQVVADRSGVSVVNAR